MTLTEDVKYFQKKFDFPTCEKLGLGSESYLDRHQNRKSDSDPDRHQNDAE
jgi:hypothetical protein